ncbi:MAG: hypothetical protein KF788_11025 [Piscinibacter sp.]|nr:hypothetical protein [Piscinibacter sp.]
MTRTLWCFIGLHGRGRFCPYCGRCLTGQVPKRFRVTERSTGRAVAELCALDEAHALALCRRRWHPDNLVVTAAEALPR